MPKELEIKEIADTVLKIAAIISVSSAVFAIGYNYYQCVQDTWNVIFSIPVFLLSLLIFGIALGLTDKTFGTFRNLDMSSGPLKMRVLRLFLYLLGVFSEISLGVVAIYAFLVAGSVPNCIA